MKTSGFLGSCAPAIASLRLSRLFVHSQLALGVPEVLRVLTYRKDYHTLICGPV
jgi:hypothetical protein